MPRKLNDKQVLELVTEYANGISISALAKRYKIDWTTCKRYIESERDLQEKCKAIKNEAVTEFIKANSKRITDVMSLCLELLPTALKGASARDIAGVYGRMAEISINNVESKEDKGNDQKKTLDELCKAINKVAENG